jgi:hypothetical protein
MRDEKSGNEANDPRFERAGAGFGAQMGANEATNGGGWPPVWPSPGRRGKCANEATAYVVMVDHSVLPGTEPRSLVQMARERSQMGRRRSGVGEGQK